MDHHSQDTEDNHSNGKDHLSQQFVYIDDVVSNCTIWNLPSNIRFDKED